MNLIEVTKLLITVNFQVKFKNRYLIISDDNQEDVN